jgi:3-oxoacyl-[acyl-carrier protein] reductase
LTAPPVAIVTGAASGIGRKVAEALDARGCSLLLADVNEAALAPLAKPPRVAVRRLDVRDPAAWRDAVEEAVRRFGRLDVLFNIAGALRPGAALEATPADVDLHLDVNAKGVIHGTLAAAPVMVRQGAGHIVNMGSLAALAPVPGLSLYSASKFAVRGFSLSIAEELRPRGVAVTLVCPDAVRTPMLDLQVDAAAAALTFSGSRALEADEVAEALVGHVLARRPREVMLPLSRGILAKIAGALPDVAAVLAPVLTRRGLAAQAAERRRRGGGA